jgi:hypothetical protein
MQPEPGYGQPASHPPRPYPFPQQPPGFGGPPPGKNRTPLVIGAIVAVAVLGIAAVLIFTLSGRGEDGGTAATTVGSTTTAAPPSGVTYEITGTASGPLTVVYAGSGGEDVERTVSTLPWSVTVDPPPNVLSIFALPTSIDDEPVITLTVKRGTEVLRTCEGGAPCITDIPS